MNNKKQIEKVLNELNIIYKEEEVAQNGFSVDTYLIHFVANNVIFFGGVFDGGANDDKHITILFFFEEDNLLKKDEITILKKVNELNNSCKYGNFTYDGKDIMYTLSIPLIERNHISEKVFKFYFENVISVLKGTASEIIEEYEQ